MWVLGELMDDTVAEGMGRLMLRLAWHLLLRLPVWLELELLDQRTYYPMVLESARRSLVKIAVSET